MKASSTPGVSATCMSARLVLCTASGEFFVISFAHASAVAKTSASGTTAFTLITLASVRAVQISRGGSDQRDGTEMSMGASQAELIACLGGTDGAPQEEQLSGHLVPREARQPGNAYRNAIAMSTDRWISPVRPFQARPGTKTRDDQTATHRPGLPQRPA